MSPLKYRNEKKEYGRKEALKRLWRRDRGVLGYLVLAGAVAYSFNIERVHSNENRTSLANETHEVLVNSCVRGNELRSALTDIMQSSKRQSQVFYRDDPIRQEQIKVFYNEAIGKLRPIDCTTAYPEPED